MINEKNILSEINYFESELRYFEKIKLNEEFEITNEEDYDEYIYIMKSIDDCHSKYAHAVAFNLKTKLRIDKLNKITESND